MHRQSRGKQSFVRPREDVTANIALGEQRPLA